MRSGPRLLTRHTARAASKALVLGIAGALLLLAAGCTFSSNPQVNAIVRRQQCSGFPLGGVIPYLVAQAVCRAAGWTEPADYAAGEEDFTVVNDGTLGEAETVAYDWQDMCRDAAAGDGAARSALAWHYRNGWSPAPQDRVEAYKWFALAADAGFDVAADYRDEVGAELTPEQMTEAQTRLAAWSPAKASCPVAQASAKVVW